LGEVRASGYLGEVKVAGSEADFATTFGETSFKSFVRELKKAKNEQAQSMNYSHEKKRATNKNPAQRQNRYVSSRDRYDDEGRGGDVRNSLQRSGDRSRGSNRKQFGSRGRQSRFESNGGGHGRRSRDGRRR
jgi:hypothetical protein